MSAESLSKIINGAIEAFVLQIEQFLLVVKEIRSQFVGSWESPSLVIFTPLQWTLLKVLSILVLFTIALIGYSWKVYGKVITEKFVRPSTLKEIEELKLSVAKLKLPKEHSPRI